ncbi:MAG TPA: glycosyltransferase family 9 protein [Xanthomonadaceae bacterium]|nr:glycosyltransferase family 9 protein [Xanthomonadaceae bacterium]
MKLRRSRYDLAVDPCDGSQSGRLLLVIAKAKHAIGIRTFESNQDPQPQKTRNEPVHLAKLPVFLLRNALSPQGLDTGMDYAPMTIGLSATERQTAHAALEALTANQVQGRARATVGIFAGATGGKRYDTDWWLRFVNDMRARHSDYAMVELGSEHGQSHLPSVLPSYSSRNIREVAALISNMTCFVSADCGVMHLASASGATTVGMFSMTDPSKYAPYGHGSQAIDTKGKGPEEVALLVTEIMAAAGVDAACADAACVDAASSDTADNLTGKRWAST